jgi:CHAT domain-containing protein
MGTSRRDFLLGLGALAVPAVAANRSADAVVLHFDGTSSLAKVCILDGKQPSSFPIDAAGADTYAKLLQSPPSREYAAAIDSMSRDLYSRLWKPVDDRGIDEANVFVRATGVFKNFPFESLRRRTTFVGQSFMIRHLVGNRGRGSVRRLGSVLPGPNFVYAPVVKNGLDLPKLGAAIQEARFVNGIMHGQLRMGAKATRAQLDQDTSGPFSVLHFATHGTRSRGEAPSLALRKPTESEADGIELLRPADIRAMRMNGRLVVLSACESAIKPDSRNALGLGEAFVSAGVKEVIAARWTVDDDAALVFMKSLYSRLARRRDTASALRYARASMIDSDYLPYSHPYFWASFVSLVAG